MSKQSGDPVHVLRIQTRAPGIQQFRDARAEARRSTLIFPPVGACAHHASWFPMTFLPIVERELRVRARLKSTYRFRMWAAVGAISVVGLLLITVETFAAAGKFGAMVFHALAWLSFSYCLLDGARNTADCLSEEKRSGTLGLLFLTDLRPYDVVLGKLMATSLNSFYGLLAIFPPLAIPLVLGGVTVGEFWRLVLALINTLFFSLATGLAVSAASRDERRAWTGTVALVLGFTLGPALLALHPTWASSFMAALSPLNGFLNVFDAAYSATPDRYWRSIWSVQLLSWGCLAAAMLVLPHAWQDRPSAEGNSWLWNRLRACRDGHPARDKVRGWKPQRQAGSRPHCEGADDFAGRSLMLDGNPMVWLVARGRGRQTFLWTLAGVAGAVGAAAWALTAGAMAMATAIFAAMFLVHLTMAVWVASEACHLFAGARESGTMELLLCTPLSPHHIVEGHMLGLRRLFHRPVAVLLAVEGLLLAAQVFVMGAGGTPLMACVLLAVAVGLCLAAAVLDLVAVARYGMWQGLANHKPAKALTRTVLRVLVLPLVFLLLCTGGLLLPLIWPLKNLVLINYAREQMRRQFRSLLTERYGWAEEAELVGQPSKRARASQLPPVPRR
jgi:ABC-type transport system involved in multi-copper enzyme maturation permease subunit